jgi:ABC-type nitrate/sulfonate/bicarbonate transport system substrate-binding protein
VSPATGAPSVPQLLRVGGVPEHFNLPWHLAIETGALEDACTLDWHDYPSGTGAMLADLVQGKLDLAVLLTEGAALGLARGLPIHAVSLYTQSPLIWGVHTAPNSRFEAIGKLAGARFAISRMGSGSHLMSLALALEQEWPVAALRFEIVDDLRGANAAFREDRADVFLWEHFTTEPEIEAGRMRRIGDFVAPWPAWVLCARRPVWEAGRDVLTRLLAVVLGCAADLQRDPGRAALIARRYELREAAVADWLEQTRWVAGPTEPGPALGAASAMLRAAGLLPAA